MLILDSPTRPHPSSPFATSNNVSFSFHSYWVISLSVDTGNKGNHVWLIVADIGWQNLYTPVGTQRQGEQRRASDYEPVSGNQKGISKWEITFSLTKSIFATGKQSGVSCNKYSMDFIYKMKIQFWQPGIKKYFLLISQYTTNATPDLKFSNEITNKCLSLYKQTRKIPWLCLHQDNFVYQILLGATNWALCQVLWSPLKTTAFSTQSLKDEW